MYFQNFIKGKVGLRGLKGATGAQGYPGLPGLSGEPGIRGQTGNYFKNTDLKTILSNYKYPIKCYH